LIVTPGDVHVTDPTRRTRTAALLAGATGVLFFALVLTASNGPWLAPAFARPLRAVALLTALAATPVAVRLLAHSGPAAMPAASARNTLTGTATTLGCVGAGLLGLLAALAATALTGSAADGPDSSLGLLLALVLTTSATLTLAASAVRRARSQWAAGFERAARLGSAVRPDLLDDAATLIARAMPGSPTARGAAWLNRGLDGWRLSVARSPRPARQRRRPPPGRARFAARPAAPSRTNRSRAPFAGPRSSHERRTPAPRPVDAPQASPSLSPDRNSTAR